MQKNFIFILLLINSTTLMSMNFKSTIFTSKNDDNKNQIHFSAKACYTHNTKIISNIYVFYHYNPLTKNIQIANKHSYCVDTQDNKTIKNLLASNEKIKDIFSTNPDALTYLFRYVQHSQPHMRAYYEIIEQNDKGSYVTQSFPLKFVWSEGQTCLLSAVLFSAIAVTLYSYYLQL